MISPSFFSLSHTIYPVIQTTYYFTLFFSLPFIRFFQFHHQTKTRLIWFSVISLSVFGQGIIDFDDEQPSQAGIALVQLQTKHKSPDAHINNNNNILYVYKYFQFNKCCPLDCSVACPHQESDCRTCSLFVCHNLFFMLIESKEKTQFD